MKKKILYFLLIMLLVVCFKNVKAEEKCENDPSAENINISVETFDGETNEEYQMCEGDFCDHTSWVTPPPQGPTYYINFKNLTDDMYIVISNDANKYYETATTEETISSDKFTNGSYKYQTISIDFKINYTIKIYKSSSQCLILSKEVTGPIYNQYLNTKQNICEKIPKYENCSQIWLKDQINEDEFYNKALKYADANEKNIKDLVPDYIKIESKNINNKKNIFKNILIGISIFIIIIIVGVLIFKIRRVKNEK